MGTTTTDLSLMSHKNRARLGKLKEQINELLDQARQIQGNERLKEQRQAQARQLLEAKKGLERNGDLQRACGRGTLRSPAQKNAGLQSFGR